MTYQLCLGRACKLGWKYNESINKLISDKDACSPEWKYSEWISNEEKARNIVQNTERRWEYFAYPLSANDIPCWASFVCLLVKFIRGISGIHKFPSATKLQKTP